MTEPAPPVPENPESAIPADPCFHLETKALAGLEALAEARGVSTTEALHQVLEAGIRQLVREDALTSQGLSKKQQLVLTSLQAGHSVKEIAAQLGVLEGTVRTHIRRMRCRLNHSDLLSLRFQRAGKQGPADPSFATNHLCGSILFVSHSVTQNFFLQSLQSFSF